jgi:hypothetical protein
LCGAPICTEPNTTLSRIEESIMKRAVLLSSVLAVVAIAVVPLAHAEESDNWFDLENCAMCKNLTAEKGLMDNMKWENHVISNGALSITTVAPGYEKALARAMANMEKASKQLQAGETMHLCNFCQSYGALLMAGAKFESVETGVGTIDLMTSSDPAVVGMIQTHAKRTIDEYNKMVAHEHQPVH